MPYICIDCEKELPDFYTFCDIEQTKKTSLIDCYKHVERKVSIFELRKQKISVLCPSCNQETPIFTADELEKIKEHKELTEDKLQKEKTEKASEGFNKYL